MPTSIYFSSFTADGPPAGRRSSGFSRCGHSLRRRCRLGLAVTELAIGMPVLMLVLLGTMETCTMIRTQQKLKIAAYEGARVGILPDAEASNVKWHCETLCQQFGVINPEVSMSPADPSMLAPGDWFEVRVNASSPANSLTGWTFGTDFLRASMSLRRN